jgi:excisionase family DNA binding protein
MLDESAAPGEGRLTFTVEQAAALLGISKSTAYESAHRGELPVLRFGRRLVVTRATLERLLDVGLDGSSNERSNETRRAQRIRWIRVSNRGTPGARAEPSIPGRPPSTD